MKKQLFIVACVLGILCALVLPAFAYDTQEVSYYQYVLSIPSKNDFGNYFSVNMPSSFTVAHDVVSSYDDSVIWHTGDTVVMASYYTMGNTYATINFTVNGTSGRAYLAYESPFYVYAEESSVDAVNGYDTVTGTPVYAPAPSPFGSSVNDGVSNSIGFAGEVLDFIVDSPILICVGVAVGVALLAWGISKVKDLVKGY